MRGLHSQAAINERCLELGKRKAAKVEGEEGAGPPRKRAKKGEGVSGGCPYNKVHCSLLSATCTLLPAPRTLHLAPCALHPYHPAGRGDQCPEGGRCAEDP